MKIKVVIEKMGIEDFYDAVALNMGYERVNTFLYDCTKIYVARNIQDLIFNHYEDLKFDVLTIGMNWALYGPKTDDSLEDFEVVVSDGFIAGTY